MGEPDSQQEQNYGDAGCAILVVQRTSSLKRWTYSVSQEFLGTWRTEEQIIYALPGAFETKFGYNRFHCRGMCKAY